MSKEQRPRVHSSTGQAVLQISVHAMHGFELVLASLLGFQEDLGKLLIWCFLLI